MCIEVKDIDPFKQILLLIRGGLALKYLAFAGHFRHPQRTGVGSYFPDDSVDEELIARR